MPAGSLSVGIIRRYLLVAEPRHNVKPKDPKRAAAERIVEYSGKLGWRPNSRLDWFSTRSVTDADLKAPEYAEVVLYPVP